MQAELTYPASEGISAGLVSGMINVAALVLLMMLDKLPPDWLSGLVTLTVLMCAGLLVCVKEAYQRADYDEGNKMQQ